ncbi:S-adenosyl-L-methionine-dependent methyltransferase [Fistulina hepatica ATCC 64428]|uniref:S-adenosyl-L-methionine-dependent methyltransferase n=1 Tax=Fistulina hepatica ATCC 64428 TaxID=1128425 RepID=A0A0D7AE14_9AGAR|nr:S-adenosyl-L-methionine-dependent methyltransferase [Fistulina hepatica ATCC 64428]KIY48101.1 S-adenosyl-L-methionine-dependent methyltransferase [Fistulina hepatica ATCC 64428]
MAENLKALARLILESVDTIDKSCTESGLLFPRLDQPFSPSSEAARNLPGVSDASNIVVAAAAQLIAETRNPVASLASMSLGWTSSTCMEVAEEGHIPEILREAGPQGLHVNDIAKINGMDAYKLSRFLRYLATSHIFNEVAPDVFSHNSLSSVMDTGKSVKELVVNSDGKHEGANGVSAFVGAFTDELGKAALALPEALTDPELAHALDANKCGITKAFNTDLTYFQWLDRPANMRRMRRIGMAMHGVTQMLPPNSMLRGFDFQSLPEGAVMIDVGGGVGSVSLEVAREHPHMKFIIVDRPNEIIQAGKVCSLSPVINCLRLSSHDFFQPFPDNLKAPDVFLVRMILHDWADPHSITILSHMRAAAGPKTKLIVVDHVLRYPCEAPSSIKDIKGYSDTAPVPAPLLRNMGTAGTLAHQFSILMTGIQNGEERTLDRWQMLFDKSGWVLKEVRKTEGTGIFHPHIICEPNLSA